MLIHIDMLSALRDGISFQLASNGAVLTAGEDGKGVLPLKYVSKVEERKSGEVIWRRGGGEEDTGGKARTLEGSNPASIKV